MAKTGVLSLSPYSINRILPFRKYYLMFEKVYIDEGSIERARDPSGPEDILSRSILETSGFGYFNDENFTQNINTEIIDINLKEIEVLHNKSFIEVSNHITEIKKNKTDKNLLKQLYQLLKNHTIPDITLRQSHIEDAENSTARIISLINQVKKGEDSFPIFIGNPPNRDIGKKTEVINFLLSQIPEPNDDVSWEQLFEFKADQDTMKKYYALIKWINDMARKNVPLNEIEEEYLFLYHDYANQYRIHKVKHKMGIIETVVTAAIDSIIGQLSVGKISTSLFSIWKHDLNLLEAETKFTGREVAYIYKAQESFK